MTDIDPQVEKAIHIYTLMGYHHVEMVKGWGGGLFRATSLDGAKKELLTNPFRDLNQAVAFAEWARTKLSDCYFKIMDDIKGWEVIVREIAQPNKLRGWAVLASLAEALCLATLQALAEEFDDADKKEDDHD